MKKNSLNMISILQEQINKNKKIIIFQYSEDNLLELLSKGIDNEQSSIIEIWHSIKGYSALRCTRFFSQEDINEILKMYFLYDFSDKVITISDSLQYGSLFNYVKTGILTKQEMVDSLLYKI